MKFLTIIYLFIFFVAFTACKSDAKKSDQNSEMEEAMKDENDDDLDSTEIEEDLDYLEMVESAIEAMQENNEELAIEYLNKAAEDIFGSTAATASSIDKQVVAKGLRSLASQIEDGAISSSDELIEAIKKNSILNKIFSEEVIEEE